MKTFGQTLKECLESFAIKLVSFKNIGYFVAVPLGCVMAKALAATFQAWSTYMLILTALFFTSNALQKWILGRLIPCAGDEPIQTEGQRDRGTAGTASRSTEEPANPTDGTGA